MCDIYGFLTLCSLAQIHSETEMNELVSIARPHLVGGVWLNSEYDGAATGDKYSKYRNVVMNHSIIEDYIYKLN